MINLETYLANHQKDALGRMRNGKVLWGGVGSGKSRVAIAYYLQKEAPKDVYVITTARKRDENDWQHAFYEVNIGPKSGPTGFDGTTESLDKAASCDDRRSESPRGGSPGRGGTGFRDDGISEKGEGCGPIGSPESGGLPRDPGNLPRSKDRTKRPGESGHVCSAAPGVSGGSLRTGDGVLRRAKNHSVGGREGPDSPGAGSVVRGSDRAVSSRVSSGEQVLGIQQGISHGASASGNGGREGFEAGQYPWVLTVDSWNNIAKYADVMGAFFIFDEQRLVGSGDWSRKFLRIAKHNNWIMLSATPGDVWMDYVPLFVANGFYKNRTEFKREHVVYNTFTKFPKVDRYIGQGRLIRQRNELLVHMPFTRRTTRHHIPVELPYDKERLDEVLKKRWHVYEERPLRDVAEMFSVARRVVNSDPSRLEKVYELWEKHPRLIVYYNFNYELMSLRSISDGFAKDSKSGGIPTTTIGSKNHSRSLSSPESSTTPQLAEWNGHKHQPLPVGDKWIYLVQYIAGAEAWECVTTDAMIRYSRNYSWKNVEQSEGRIDRMHTTYSDLYYYDFTSDSWVDRAIGRSLKAKETFNEKKYAGLFKG